MTAVYGVPDIILESVTVTFSSVFADPYVILYAVLLFLFSITSIVQLVKAGPGSRRLITKLLFFIPSSGSATFRGASGTAK